MIQYWVISINKEKFKEEYACFEKMISAQEGSINQCKASDERPIKKLTLVESNVGKSYKIVINDDYKKIVLVNGTGTWNVLLRLGKKESVEADGRKSALDYLNTNKHCQLYTKANYSLTKILSTDDGDIKSNIEIDVISEKALETRRNQLKKDLS
jgi:thymidylate synthase ThyX